MDLADAHILALKRLNNGGDSAIFNLGNGEGFSVKQVIEVKGHAVLPGRLKEELEIFGRYMVADDYAEKIKNDYKVEKHLDWAEKIYNKYYDINGENVDKILKDEV